MKLQETEYSISWNFMVSHEFNFLEFHFLQILLELCLKFREIDFMEKQPFKRLPSPS